MAKRGESVSEGDSVAVSFYFFFLNFLFIFVPLLDKLNSVYQTHTTSMTDPADNQALNGMEYCLNFIGMGKELATKLLEEGFRSFDELKNITEEEFQ